ncbi:MAG: hypothetical protein ACI8QZ_002975 [Chlamydiales bacterium]|jgi:protocatechuate 3,4-dioxygenase beta subunit
MSAQRLLPVISILIVAILGGLWFAFSGETSDGSLPSAITAGVELPPPDAATDQPVETIDPGATPDEVPRSDLSNDVAATSDDQRSISFDVSDASWIDVDVHSPDGRIDDDSLHVLTLAAGPDDEDQLDSLCTRLARERIWAEQRERLEKQSEVAWSRRPVENAGVRVPIPPDATRAGFLVDGRFLFLERPLQLPVTDDTRRVTLETTLGAHVQLDWSLPAGAAEREVSIEAIEGELTLKGSWMFRRGARTAPVAYELDLADGPSFDLRAVPADSLLNLSGEIDGLAPFKELGLRFEAREQRTVQVRFALGGEISGRVLDSAGNPIDGAEVGIASGGALAMMTGTSGPTVETDGEGRFLLRGTPTGSVDLEVEATGWLATTTEDLELAEGQTLGNVDIVLEAGAQIAGRVLFPDGQPAAEAQIQVRGGGTQRGPWRGRSEPIESTTDAAGRFTIRGLGEGPVDLIASFGREPEGRSAWRMLEIEPEGDEASKDGARQEPPVTGWRASALGIETGSDNVELVLVELAAVRGTVHDDRGQPITDFQVSAQPNSQSATPWARTKQVGTSVEDSPDGSFEIWGLDGGDWSVSVRADGFADGDGSQVNVNVPHSGAPLELVLSRAGTLTGIVLDPLGQPVRAQVIASDGENAAWWSGGGERTESEPDGTFELEGVPLGTLALRAESEDWAASEPITVDVSAAQTVTDLTLVLRNGGMVTGEVFDAEGQPSAGRQVSISENGMGGGMMGDGPTTTTDSAGYFALEHVTPGTWIVSAGPSDTEMLKIMSEAKDQSGFMEMFSETDTTSVEVVDGEETHVTLGGDPIAPVRLVGRVTRADEPVPEAQVVALAEGGSLMKGMKMTTSENDGAFEVTVDRPGAYIMTVQNGGRGSQVRFMIDVPETEEFAVDLNLPSGRIQGTVYTSDGTPAARIQLRLSSDAEAQFIDGTSGVQTDEQGQFEFTGLWAGTYTVRAGAVAGMFGSGGEARYATSILSNIDVDTDATTSGVDLTLASASKVQGTVRDQDGATVSGASIFVRDEQGRLLSPISGTVTNAAGDFEYEGVSPGMVTVSARTKVAASRASAPLRVDPDSTSEVDLILESGTTLIVEVVDGEGEALRATVRVFDENDFEVGNMMTVASFQEMFTDGFSTRETRVGPLTPGKYRVEATDAQGRRARKPVTLKGQESRKVKLRLKD